MSTRNLLQSLFVKDLPINKPVTILPTDKIEYVLSILSEKRFLALPVLSADGELVGMIDRKDIIMHILDHNWETLKEQKQLDELNDEFILKEYRDQLLMGTVKDAIRKDSKFGGTRRLSSQKHKHALISNTSTIMEAVSLLSKVSRLLVMDESGEILSILSQGDVIKFIGRQALPDDISSKSLQTLSITLSHKIFSPFDPVDQYDTTIKVFQKMMDDGKLAYPIFDENKEDYIGHLSATDFTVEILDKLLLPVVKVAPLKGIMSLSPEGTFKELLDIILECGFHRVYIVEGAQALGVVTLHDIMAFLSRL